jgi:uncharacterized protein HemX
MSATTTQPMTGHANQAAPLGALAILVGALALGAVGVALGQGYKAASAAAVPADVQAALYAQRMGEKAPLFSAEDSLLIQRRGEFNDRANAFPAAISGPRTGAQKGLGGPTGETSEKPPLWSGHHIR